MQCREVSKWPWEKQTQYKEGRNALRMETASWITAWSVWVLVIFPLLVLGFKQLNNQGNCVFALSGGLHVCPNVLDHGAMASSAVSRCNHHTHSFPNTASDAGSVPQTTKIVQADLRAGGRGAMFLTPLFSSTCDLVCLIPLSDLFNCLSASAPFHHLSTHFLTEAVDSPCSKNLFFLFLALSLLHCRESQEDWKVAGNLSHAARRRGWGGGNTLKRTLIETSSVLLWQRSYFWPCLDWQTANLCECVCVSTAEAASSEAPPSTRWLVWHWTPSSPWEREGERW